MDRLNESLKLHDLPSVIINNAFDAIIYYTPVRDKDNNLIDFTFSFLNDTVFKFFSGKREDYLGKNLKDIFPFVVQSGVLEWYKKTLETGEPLEKTFYYNQDGIEGWYRNYVVKYDNGIIVYFRDISKRKKLELEVQINTEKLQKLLKEKETLLKEVNHRIKNNLQLLVGMLHLQNERIEDPHLKELLNTASQRIITVAKIHQKLYERADVFSVDLPNFIGEVVNSIKNLYQDKSIVIKFDIENIKLPLEYLVNVSLIVNELVTNSFKHAFNENQNGEIVINLKQEECSTKLFVTDNGKGIENEELEKTDSLGLLLIKSFVEQMNGTLEIKNYPATFQITFPLEEN